MATRKNPKHYIVDKDEVEVSDIDLDEEEFYSGGERLTEARAEQIAADALAQSGRGRPSLSGHAAKSPSIAIRVTPSVRTRIEKRAKDEGKTVSQVARDALEAYI